MVGHAVAAILLQHSTQHLTNEHQIRYERSLLLDPAIHLQKCTGLNLATLLPWGKGDLPREIHDCISTLKEISNVHPDIQDLPLEKVDYNLFTDGLVSQVNTNQSWVGYGVIAERTQVLEAAALPAKYSAQAAELFALAQACELAQDMATNIYTDSKYTFDVCHRNRQIWKHRWFLTAAGTPLAT